MATSFIPGTHAEREQVATMLERALGRADVDPLVRDLDGRLFAGARAEWKRAWTAHREAEAALRVAREVGDAADREMDRAVRLFVGSVRDTDGRLQPRVVAEMLGGMLPGELVTVAAAEALKRTEQLLAQLPSRPGLVHDAALAEGLRATRAALAEAAAAEDDAEIRVLGTGGQLTRATMDFDRGYGRLVRALLATLGSDAVSASLPRFVRTGTRPEGDDPAAGAPLAPTTPEPEPAAVPAGGSVEGGEG